jgi:ribonuclease HI
MSEQKIDAIILHTDGSCVPNPGDGGWGFHGYAYSLEAPKKGSGNADYYVTNEGYVEKTMLDAHRKGGNPYESLDERYMNEETISILDRFMEAQEVTPLFYLDGFGPAPIDEPGLRTTNNVAELCALIMALEYCQRENIRTIQIYADSEYTLDGWNKVLPLWAKNNWCRRDGQTIKNVELWKRAWRLKNEMKDFNIHASWLKGHSIFMGNVMADMNANLGKNMTVAGMKEPIIKRSEATGYWKMGEVDKHPLMVHQKLFFNGDHSNHVPGTYYMGAVDKDLGLFGKRLSDTSYSVLKLAQPIESIEKLIEFHCENGEQANEMVVAHLSTFFKPMVFKQFTEYGTFSVYQPVSHSNSMVSADKQIVTEVIEPPKKALEAVMAMNNVAMWMNDFLDGKDEAKRFTITDLTPHLYEASVIQKKKQDVHVAKLLASIKPGVASISVDANFRDSNGVEHVLPTILTFGIDLPDRNGLKRVEESVPKVTMLSWEESPGVFRYFTVIQSNDDVGAYCGYYSNLRLNKAGKKKAK